MILRRLMFVLVFSVLGKLSMAEEVDSFLSRKLYDPVRDDDILKKSLLGYGAYNHTSSHPWVTKGKLYTIKIGTNAPTRLYRYVDENGTSYGLTGSFFALSNVFRKEGLFLLDKDAISQNLIRFMCETTLNHPSNMFLGDELCSIYKKGLSDKEFSPLRELINQNGGEVVNVKIDESKGTWSSTFFVITGPGLLELWEFEGENNATKFTVNSLKRKLLDAKIKRLEFI